jgi:hypothetical protein
MNQSCLAITVTRIVSSPQYDSDSTPYMIIHRGRALLQQAEASEAQGDARLAYETYIDAVEHLIAAYHYASSADARQKIKKTYMQYLTKAEVYACK